MKKIQIRTDGSVRVTTVNEEPSKTQQSFADECDINKIMQKYHKGLAITHINRNRGIYADLSTFTDYQLALHKVMDAQQAFEALPARMRSRFQNDPQQLIEFLADPNNKNEAIELGLIEKKPENNATINDAIKTGNNQIPENKQS
ncbi:MAG: internal scaffolding protein [Arizlama microvirus]|nr:MAG: internal scaffolding protein [Arizlama microvirus]